MKIEYVGRGPGYRQREAVQKRCALMREMRGRGDFLKEIGLYFGLNHSSISHHVNKRCTCDGVHANARKAAEREIVSGQRVSAGR